MPNVILRCSMADAHRGAIVPVSHSISGFSHSLAPLRNSDAGHHRRDEDGEDQRADQRKADRPGHRLEEPAFDGLQVKMGR